MGLTHVHVLRPDRAVSEQLARGTTNVMIFTILSIIIKVPTQSSLVLSVKIGYKEVRGLESVRLCGHAAVAPTLILCHN
jgi:hypothetical protein